MARIGLELEVDLIDRRVSCRLPGDFLRIILGGVFGARVATGIGVVDGVVVILGVRGDAVGVGPVPIVVAGVVEAGVGIPRAVVRDGLVDVRRFFDFILHHALFKVMLLLTINVQTSFHFRIFFQPIFQFLN